jgi:hypothetical protein
MSVTSYGALVRDVAGECSSERVVKKYRDLRNGKRVLQSTEVVRDIDDDPITLNSLAESPKVVKHDGKCYDAAALARWYREHNTLPHNRAAGTLSAKDLHVIGIVPLFHFIRHNDFVRFNTELAHMYDAMYRNKTFSIHDLERVDMRLFKLLSSEILIYGIEMHFNAASVALMIATIYDGWNFVNIILTTHNPFGENTQQCAEQFFACNLIGCSRQNFNAHMITEECELLRKYNVIHHCSLAVFLCYLAMKNDDISIRNANDIGFMILRLKIKSKSKHFGKSELTQVYIFKNIQQAILGDNPFWNEKCEHVLLKYELVDLNSVQSCLEILEKSNENVFNRIKSIVEFAAKMDWIFLIVDVILLYAGEFKNELIRLALTTLSVRSDPEFRRIIANHYTI